MHPDQLAPVNAAYLPSAAELARAERIVAAFREAEARGEAAVQVDGEMVDYPVAYRAQAMIDSVRRPAESHFSFGRLPLAATLAIQTLVSTAVYCAPVMAPAAAPALGLSPAAVGYFVTVVYVGSMIGTATAGGWSARFGPIRVSQVGLLLCLAGLATASSGALRR